MVRAVLIGGPYDRETREVPDEWGALTLHLPLEAPVIRSYASAPEPYAPIPTVTYVRRALYLPVWVRLDRPDLPPRMEYWSPREMPEAQSSYLAMRAIV